MLRNRLYYLAKPFVPASVRRSVRRWFVLRKRARVQDRWPVLPGSERPPADWQGWPDGKEFGVVLTHDVEGKVGLAKSRQLMELEKGLGFRASFNFVPEGEYQVSSEFRKEIEANGFEVGVHDLNHDGKLYDSRQVFASKAARINQYLKDWGAVGFRAGFMYHNLDWLHDLEILYDASTFDTDPFEPQPDGANTIFPFWVPGRNGGGYFEMPYTLPQDSTLFLILGERTIEIWLKKLEWIVSHGGMVLFNTHPDYIDFSGNTAPAWQYSSALIREFLTRIRTEYAGRYWHGTPRELAGHLASSKPQAAVPRAAPASNGHVTASGAKIWIDLDNTPHVPLFVPIIDELKRRGYQIVLTARDAFQVCALAEKMNLPFVKIGRHHGKNKIRKAFGLFCRAAQMVPLVLREKPVIALSHGSRAQALTCNLLGVPAIFMEDYEHSSNPFSMRPTWEIVPEVITQKALVPTDKIRRYPGIKEDVYVPRFKPNDTLREELGLTDRDIVVVARPPAVEAHYYVPESSELFDRFMNRASAAAGVRVVLLPRNKKQGEALKAANPSWFTNQRTIIPDKALDGLDVIWNSDLVVSGGGTMNREAAALGMPVYSVFRGTMGAVDLQLQKEGRLVLVESKEGADRIPLVRRQVIPWKGGTRSAALASIADHVEEIIRLQTGK